ncbi:MAG: pyruvate ferredoxin oxidoreductase [Planctomycetes bacterium]|nr:pyruvate ferredoxin oxidoreductase [Planctomycetota bacterium]
MALKSLKEYSAQSGLLAGGHRACSGCPAPTAIRMALNAADTKDIVVAFSTGCMEVVTTIYPFTAWKIPYIHSAFENVAATISGVETAYNALKAKGKITRDIKFMAWGGDGGTYDIGLQSLSGALERGHRYLHICYDNEGYMNTGIQRSGSTPKGAETNTSQIGSVQKGKQQQKKDLTAIVIAHHIPYVAQASVHNWKDFMTKVQKGLAVKDGPAFINVLAPCHRGWRVAEDEGFEYARLAVETCTWHMFEVENGKLTINYKPKTKLPVQDYLLKQGRFRHLNDPANAALVAEIQADVDKKWQELLDKESKSL